MHLLLALLYLGTAAAQSCPGGVTGRLGDAVPVMDNPKGLSYGVHFARPGEARGWLNATTADMGVTWSLDVVGLPEGRGPYMFHVHLLPVPSDGNCSGTLGHLDPYNRTDTPACNPANPATCQVGDLSGKYGVINATSVSRSFVDMYSALTSGNVAYFGNRSAVLHDFNKTRIACGNFTRL